MTMDASDRIVPKCFRALQLIPFLRRRGGLLVSLLIGLTGLLLTVLSLLPDTTELSYTVTRTTMLTELPEAEGLVGEYYFEDKRIEQLWQLEVSLVNTGNRTLVGQGQIANVLGNGLAAEVPTHFRVLRADVYRNDPGAAVVLDGEQELVLRFTQWRRSEVVELVLYVEAAPIVYGAEPEIVFEARQLVDGEIVRVPARDDKQARRTSLFDRFGNVLGTAVRILGSLVLGLLAFIFGVFLFLVLKDYATASKAGRRITEHREAVADWVSAHPEINEATRERIRAAAYKPGRLLFSQLILNDPTITSDMIQSFPRHPHEPMFSSHRSRTIGVLCAAILCTLFVMLVVELILSI